MSWKILASVLAVFNVIQFVFLLYMKAAYYTKRECDELFRLEKTCDIVHSSTTDMINNVKDDIKEIKDSIKEITISLREYLKK